MPGRYVGRAGPYTGASRHALRCPVGQARLTRCLKVTDAMPTDGRSKGLSPATPAWPDSDLTNCVWPKPAIPA